MLFRSVSSALGIVSPFLLKSLLDSAIPHRDPTLISLLAGGMIAISMLASVLGVVQTLLSTQVGQRVMHDLRRELFAHLQRLPIPFFDRTPLGRVVTRVTSDVEALNELFASGVVAGLGDLFTLAAITALMVTVDWRKIGRAHV